MLKASGHRKDCLPKTTSYQHKAFYQCENAAVAYVQEYFVCVDVKNVAVVNVLGVSESAMCQER